MNGVIVCLIIIMSSFCVVHADDDELYARSFMLPRSASNHLSIHQHLWHSIVYSAKKMVKGCINITPIYQKSLYQDQATGYFLIDGKRQLLVSGDANTSDQYDRDIRAEWLGLPASFRGTISVFPHQVQLGGWVEYTQHLKRFIDWDFFDNMWIGFRAPVLFVKNRLNPCFLEAPTGKHATPSAVLEHAFNNPAWQFSHFAQETKTTGVSEIRVYVGRTFIDEDHFQLSYETTVLIPAGSHQRARYLFSAFAGLNNHAGFGNKVTLQVLLNKDPERAAWTFFVNLEGILLIQNKQYRTFDLRRGSALAVDLEQKQWSRFLMFTQEDGTILQGVNVLTRKVTVKPYNIVDLSSGWRLRIRSFEWEVGYNLWTHGEELIGIDDPIDEETCFRPFGILGSAPGKTASRSTIKTLAPDDTEFTPITNGDLEKKSGAAATALNHKVHMAFGLIHEKEYYSLVGGLGAFIDITQSSGALRTWGCWGKLAAAF